MADFMKCLELMKRKVFWKVGIPVVLAAAGALSVPHIKTAYQKSVAADLISGAKTEIVKLDEKLKKAKIVVEADSYLLMEGEETDRPYGEIRDSEAKLEKFRNDLAQNEKTFAEGKYNEVRSNLDATFGLDSGRRVTLVDGVAQEIKDLQGAVDFCEGKKNLRNEVWGNELTLIARLKSPYYLDKIPAGDERMSILPKELLAFIPVLNPELESKFQQLQPGIRNSLGFNLINHQQTLEHILNVGLNNRVKENSRRFFDNAKNAYIQVRPLNDQLLWYRPKANDGKLAIETYGVLLGKQRRAIELIKEGDDSLAGLDRYNGELHEQYYSFVSGHDRSRTTFSHTSFEPVVHTTIDSDGDIGLETRLEMKTTYSDGWKYYFNVTTVSPKSQRTDQIYVGEIDGESPWNYNSDEQVGWVRQWKKLHDDNQGIVCGWKNQLNPALGEE